MHHSIEAARARHGRAHVAHVRHRPSRAGACDRDRDGVTEHPGAAAEQFPGGRAPCGQPAACGVGQAGVGAGVAGLVDGVGRVSSHVEREDSRGGRRARDFRPFAAILRASSSPASAFPNETRGSRRPRTMRCRSPLPHRDTPSLDIAGAVRPPGPQRSTTALDFPEASRSMAHSRT